MTAYTLEVADSQEFARWWVVYRNANEDFSQSFAEQYQDIVDVPFCHWIQNDGKRVGGLIRVGHNVGDFFLISPFTDAYAALRAVLPVDEPLVAQGITSDHVHAFQMLGFQITESRCWMLRPTQAYDVHFDFTRTAPQADQTDTIAQLMVAAFSGGVGQYGARDVEAHRKSVVNYFESITPADKFHQASSVLYDSDRIVAACLIQRYKSLPTIRFVVVHPDYQRRGLARQLMQYGIDTMREDYDFVSLAVTIGNPAQGLYHRMGFMTGHVMHTLKRDG